MLRSAIKSVALFATVGVILATQQAQAGMFHRGGSSGGSWGSSGGSWGSSGGSWGSSGGSWGSSGGSWGSSGGNSVIAPSSPETVPAGTLDVSPPPPPKASSYHPTYGPLRNSATLAVKVPADAKVFVNDRATPSKGTDREYISRNLQSGNHYNYTVRVEFVRDGQTITENKTVQLVAGQSTKLDFSHGEASAVASSRTSDAPIGETPVDATMNLIGQETRLSGTCEFSNATLVNSPRSANQPKEHGQRNKSKQTSASTEAPGVQRFAYPLSTAIMTLALLGSAFWALGGLRLLRKATTCRLDRTFAILRGNSAQ